MRCTRSLAAGFFLLAALCCGCRISQQEWLARAEEGDVEALRTVGLQHYYGELGTVDYAAAAPYFRKAAEKGDPVSQYFYGDFLLRGLGGVTPDRTAAQELFAAAQAQFELKKPAADGLADLVRGEMAANGHAGKKDLAAAAEFYRHGMKQLCYPAMIRMGELFCTGGPGIGADPARGRYLLANAAKMGYPDAKCSLSAQLSVTEPERAAQLRDEAAAAGIPAALRERDPEWKDPAITAKLAHQGVGEAFLRQALAEKDELRRLALFKQAAVRSNKEALYALANYYRRHNDPARALAVAAHAGGAGLPADENGLSLPVAQLWKHRPADRLAKLDSTLTLYGEGHLAGIVNSRENFNRALAEDCEGAYYGCDWFRIARTGLPMSWAGDIFKHYLRSGGNADAGFLLNYGISAGLAGQGALQSAAAIRLEKYPDCVAPALLLRANSLAMLGRCDEAYELLQKELKLPESSVSRAALAAFADAWCAHLRTEPAKLAAVLQAPKERFSAAKALPVKQSFYDFELDREVEFAPRVAEPQL